MLNPKRLLLCLAAASLQVLLTTGCAVSSDAPPSESDQGDQGEADDDDLGTTSQAITTDDIMTRAKEWVTDKVPYCGGVNGGTDYICGGTCHRNHEPWDDYRSDCSGFVSWCWQIASDPTTDTYMHDKAGTNGWTTVQIDDMAEGDAVVCDGHIKLFSKFSASNKMVIYEESDCGLVALTTTQTFTRTGNTLKFSGDSRTYHPIRRNGLTPPVTVKGYVDSADVYVKGWAADMNATTKSIAVDLYFDGDKGKGYDVALTAADPRPDVAQSLGISPDHGFSLMTPLYYCDGASHSVYGYGTPVTGAAKELTDSPKTFTCPIPVTPAGSLRHVPAPAVMTAWKFDVHSELRWMTAEDHATHADGADWPVTPILGKTSDGAIYVVDGDSARHVINPASLKAWGFDSKTVTAWTDADLAKYQTGLDLPATPILTQQPGAPSVYVIDADPINPTTTSTGVGGATGIGGSDGVGGGFTQGSTTTSSASSGNQGGSNGTGGSGSGSTKPLTGACSMDISSGESGTGGALSLVVGAAALALSRRRRAS